MASELILNMNDASMNSDSLKEHGLILVDFWAPWCGPCRMLAPVLDRLAEEMKGSAVIGKLNIDDNEDAAVRFGISAVPTLIIFKDGQEVERITGVRPQPQLSAALKRYL